MSATATSTIAGMRVWPLTMHGDHRGYVAETFRVDRPVGVEPAQWLVAPTRAGALRGMDLHVRHDEYEILVGDILLGLRDLRRGSPTHGTAELLTFSADALAGVTIPRGVLHGFVFLSDGALVVASTQLYDPSDHLACAWDDPALGIDWPVRPELVTEEDRNGRPLAVLLEEIEPLQPLWPPEVPL